MSGQLWFVLGVGVLAGLGAGVPLGHWRGRRVGLEDGYEQGYENGYDDADSPPFLAADVTVEYHAGRNDAGEMEWQVGHTIYPELAALAALDVPEPETPDHGLAVPRGDVGLGHPSPYTGTPTPAQRRRDKHKQRGPYAPGDLPDPPTDVGAWWQAELDALLTDGQSEWLTRNLAGAA